MTAAREHGPRAQHPPTLTVVIPSYRRLDRIADLVRAYRAQGAEQIVVVLDGPHPGWQGAVEAVDDDVEPGLDLVRRHREFHAADEGGVLQGYMPTALPARRGRDQSPTYLYAREYETQARAWRAGDSALLLRSLWGGNVSLRRELYLRAEEMLPSIRLEYNEDLDLGLRLERLGASASFDAEARAVHHHSRGLTAFLAECVSRGAAIAQIEQRWGERPAQLTPMVVIPPGYNRTLAAVQRRIAARDSPGGLEKAITALYTVGGVARAWPLQDGIARMLRRAMALRGYRLTKDASGPAT